MLSQCDTSTSTQESYQQSDSDQIAMTQPQDNNEPYEFDEGVQTDLTMQEIAGIIKSENELRKVKGKKVSIQKPKKQQIKKNYVKMAINLYLKQEKKSKSYIPNTFKLIKDQSKSKMQNIKRKEKYTGVKGILDEFVAPEQFLYDLAEIMFQHQYMKVKFEQNLIEYAAQKPVCKRCLDCDHDNRSQSL